MKRLTDKRLALPPGVWQEVTREQRMGLQEIPVPSKQELYYRLFQIEEILCDGEDDYDLDRLSALCNQRMTMREEVSERFSLTAKIPLDRLREIAEAEREGRYVVLPCKFGGPVWRLYDDCDFPGDCYTKQKCRGCEYRNLFIEEQAFCLSMLSQNGKLNPPYYTTRAEAEAALATDC